MLTFLWYIQQLPTTKYFMSNVNNNKVDPGLAQSPTGTASLSSAHSPVVLQGRAGLVTWQWSQVPESSWWEQSPTCKHLQVSTCPKFVNIPSDKARSQCGMGSNFLQSTHVSFLLFEVEYIPSWQKEKVTLTSDDFLVPSSFPCKDLVVPMPVLGFH
jgi:hypothetical protein